MRSSTGSVLDPSSTEIPTPAPSAAVKLPLEELYEELATAAFLLARSRILHRPGRQSECDVCKWGFSGTEVLVAHSADHASTCLVGRVYRLTAELIDAKDRAALAVSLARSQKLDVHTTPLAGLNALHDSDVPERRIGYYVTHEQAAQLAAIASAFPLTAEGAQ